MVCGKYITIHRACGCITVENPAKWGLWTPKPVENPVEYVDEAPFHAMYIRQAA